MYLASLPRPQFPNLGPSLGLRMGPGRIQPPLLWTPERSGGGVRRSQHGRPRAAAVATGGRGVSSHIPGLCSTLQSVDTEVSLLCQGRQRSLL